MTRIHRFRVILGLLVAFGCSAITASAQPQAGQVFGDVFQTDPYYAATTTLYQLGISVGCNNVPNFCPSETLLRSDMAAFIVRAWSARVYNDPEGFPIDPNQQQYFSDVPPGPQYKYIEKLYELGITAGTVGPTIDPSTGHLTAMGQFAPASTLVNYQIAVFIARAGWLANEACTAANYGGALKPFSVSTNPNCSPNAFPSNPSEEPYFGDDCSPTQTFSQPSPGCPANSIDTYYTYIQRLGDLNVFQVPSTVTGSPGCYSCTIGQNTTILRSQMAIWTVTGMGLVPESMLNINTPTGPNVWSTLPTITVPFTFTVYDQPAASIQYGQFLLQNSASGDAIQGPLYCEGNWATADLNLFDSPISYNGGAPGNALGYNEPLADTFCTISLVSVTPVTTLINGVVTNGTQATVNFTFTPNAQGATYNVFHEVIYTQGDEPWENVGTLTVQASSNPTVTITDTTQSSGYYFAGDSYSVTVTGPTGAQVTLSENGATPVPAVNAQGSSVTNTQYVWTNTGTWGAGDIGTQAYYVAGIQIPILLQPVRPSPCGLRTYTQDVGQGVTEQLTVLVTAPQGPPPAVTFQITGSNVSAAYTGGLVSAMPGTPPAWTATLGTGNLLGEYEAIPSIQLVSANGAQTTYACKGSVGFFNVQKPTPANPGQSSCASMTGTWTASDSGEVNKTWTLTDTNGTLSGSASYVGLCNQQVTFLDVSGTYNTSTQAYTLAATNPYPSSWPCGRGTAIATNINPVKGQFSGSACGVGVGTYTDGFNTNATEILNTERVPTGETSVSAGWAGAYGSPTSGMFNVTLNTDAGYDFGGRVVSEAPPALQSSLNCNTTPAACDTCWFPNTLNYSPITKLFSNESWNVQDDQKNGTYGIDYIGDQDSLIALIQQRAPALLNSSSSCMWQFPQQMSINSESATGNDPPYATNMIVVTITLTTVSVSRGGVAAQPTPQSVHF